MKQLFIHIVFGIVLLSLVTNTAYAQDKIGIFTLNSEITNTDSVLVTGFVETDSSYKPIRLEVYDPNEELVYRPDVYFNEKGEFSWLVHPPLGKFDTAGTYTIIANHEDLSESAKLLFVVKEKFPADSLIKSSSDNNKANTADETTEPIKIVETKNKQKQSENNINQSNDRAEFLDSPIYVMLLAIISIVVIIGIIIWIKQTYKNYLQHKAPRNF